MPLPRAILFDLDDTIITEGERRAILAEVAEAAAPTLLPHSAATVAEALENAFDAFWSKSPEAKAARLRSGLGVMESRARIIAKTIATLHLPPELATTLAESFGTARARQTRIFDGAKATLDAVRKLGIKMALVTNGASDMQRGKVERFGLAQYFDHIQIEGEHGFGKPDQRAYHHAMETLGVVAADTWMIGDNLEWEVAAPQRLGIFAIWHDHLGRGLPADSDVRPDRIIRYFPELMGVLEE